MSESITDEFANADLGDSRRTRRLCKVSLALNAAPTASISNACGGWADTMAAYRLLNSDDFSAADLLAPHAAKTLERCADQLCVVVAQDTTEFDFSHMKETQGLGPLNDEGRRVFFMHSLYAVSEQGLPLGLLDAKIINRDDASFRSTGKRKQMAIEDKESYRWVEGYRRTTQLAREIPGCEVFSVSDREGDIFEVYADWLEAKEHEQGAAEWIIRANQNRALVNVVDGDSDKLFSVLEAAAALGEIEFDVRAHSGTKKMDGKWVKTKRSAHRVQQVVRAMKITPRTPYRKGKRLKEVSFWAILAEEGNPAAGEEPVRWLLLTSKEVVTFDDARRIIELYLRRWDIEVFHRVLKTGCRVERIQLMSAEALIRAVTIYAVVAWRILYFTHLGRECPEMPCGCVFQDSEWKAACAVVKRPREKGEPSLEEMIRIVGKLGGHLGRKGDGMPGPQCIWQGLARVRDFAIAWDVYQV